MSGVREFRDAVFEDVGFEHDSLLTLKHRRCGDITPETDMGRGPLKRKSAYEYIYIYMYVLLYIYIYVYVYVLRGFENGSLEPHVPKRHIPEHPGSAAWGGIRGSAVTDSRGYTYNV